MAQELTLGLLAQAHLYDPNRASIDTFANRVIDSATKMILRKRRAKKRRSGSLESLDNPVWDSDGNEVSGANLVTEADGNRTSGGNPDSGLDQVDDLDDLDEQEAVRKFVAGLMSEQRCICEQLMVQRSVSAVAESLGISRRKLAAHLKALREQFKPFGNS